MAAELILSIATIIVGIISLYIGVWIAGRCKGELRTSVSLGILIIIILIIYSSGYAINSAATTNLGEISENNFTKIIDLSNNQLTIQLVHFIIAILILAILIYLNKMIKKIE